MKMTFLKIMSIKKYKMLVVLSILTIIESSPIESNPQAMMYLSQFGYINQVKSSNRANIDEALLKDAISEFQNFAELEVTGELNAETLETMSLSRCGVKDNIDLDSNFTSALKGSRWKAKNLTYRISKYPSESSLNNSEVDNEIVRAFNLWSDYTDLTFTQVPTGKVHIDIRFEKGEHGDDYPFDGKGGTLAHANAPKYGGDTHFDDEEEWTIRSSEGTSLFQVAAHQFGHSLGLSHSDVKEALMAPFYRGFQPSFSLDIDDINEIQKLYGEKTSDKPTDHPNEELCSDSKIDTIFNNAEGEIFVFKGDVYYKLSENSIETVYPTLISSTWKELPSNIDAAFTSGKGKTYFFKGSKYWKYVGTSLGKDNYPRDISEGFPGIPDDIDTAFLWSDSERLYFFKDDKFWRYNRNAKPHVKPTYPKPISIWEGIPNNIDGVFQYTNGYTYFFKNGVYYKFNDTSLSVDRADPEFPRSIAYWWLGCNSAPSGTVLVNAYYSIEPTNTLMNPI